MIKVSLSSIIDIISGGTPKTKIPEYWNGDIGWLSVTDFNNEFRYVYNTEKTITEKGVEESNTKFLNIGDIIISARGTVGALAQIGKPMCFNQSCFGIRGKKDSADTDFLYYALKNYVKNIVKRSQGSVFDTINLKSFDLMEIEIPESKSSQKKIAKVLSDLDAKIEVNNKINAELEAMAKLIYDYWFVQFDFPFDFAQGKPDPKGKPYKSSGGKMVYNKELKREIPEGWEIGNLLNIANITTGKLDSNAEVENGAYYFYTCAVNPTKTDTYAFEDSVILIAGNNAAGNFHVNRFTGRFNAYQRTYVITAKEDKHLDYLYQVLLEQMKLMKTRGNGSQTKFLTIGMLNSIPVFKSNSIVVDEFSKITIPMYQKQVNLMNENQKLSELRDWLLPMLMNGQVTIANEELGITNPELGNELGMVAEETKEYK